MKCPYCAGTEIKVLDKRESEAQGAIRRRRECLNCEKRFTTYERIEYAPLVLLKKNGARVQFDRTKLFMGVQKACEKRPVSMEQMQSLVDELESEIRLRDEQEVPVTVIGELVMRKLRKLDKVAYIRFASVYRDFADINEFEKELKKLIRK